MEKKKIGCYKLSILTWQFFLLSPSQWKYFYTRLQDREKKVFGNNELVFFLFWNGDSDFIFWKKEKLILFFN